MKRLIRRLSKVAGAARFLKSRSRGRVPEGHVPVCVGEEMERFAVPADLLGRPVFVELLQRAAEEYGYEQAGVLRIPCPVQVFRRLLHREFAGNVGPAVSGEIWPSEVAAF